MQASHAPAIVTAGVEDNHFPAPEELWLVLHKILLMLKIKERIDGISVNS
jgi:hypothetical protein